MYNKKCFADLIFNRSYKGLTRRKKLSVTQKCWFLYNAASLYELRNELDTLVIFYGLVSVVEMYVEYSGLNSKLNWL